MKIVGITGGVGSGKSEVLRYLEEKHGASVCRADEVGRELQQEGTACYDSIVAEFGDEILEENGKINRAKLSAIVFDNPDRLAALNAIVHPAVEERLKQLKEEAQSQGKSLFVLESAILIEAGYEDFCDEIWYIYASDEVRTRRLRFFRGYSEEKTQSVIRAQKTREEYMEQSDRVIDNSRSFEETCAQLEHILDKL